MEDMKVMKGADSLEKLGLEQWSLCFSVSCDNGTLLPHCLNFVTKESLLVELVTAREYSPLNAISSGLKKREMENVSKLLHRKNSE